MNERLLLVALLLISAFFVAWIVALLEREERELRSHIHQTGWQARLQGATGLWRLSLAMVGNALGALLVPFYLWRMRRSLDDRRHAQHRLKGKRRMVVVLVAVRVMLVVAAAGVLLFES